MNILVFDNYDSFTYNLVHLVEKITHQKVTVIRNDEIPLEQVKEYDKIILSPGPGIPEEAGLLLPLIKTYAPTKSIFGVCLGLQAIGQAFGGNLINLTDVYHGVATDINVTNRAGRLFNELPDRFAVGRYHSWVVDEKSLPTELTVTARDDEQFVMALQHTRYDVSGVQFHPESVLTPNGEQILRNWLKA
ncbi:anthranilate synthase component 2 [Chitinophaga costaii]|uniref:Anthranilate synthase component 2 n=1 Tax=Chitinophaga costaii TaxID=1335309 RepID=A0A1C3ZKM8_9BACT|nr:aminodeoxychorismate/anthranilate synthase component II [Chitinophaga costaii]PUZ30413.1 aminodeoxychorismate/anthranilate synthase component II [Chitinophaga costaii]SCB82878.1 anthranilate synthase component 2 [Chitinophaga costaii]